MENHPVVAPRLPLLGPGDPQSLSPFKSRATTLAVLWSVLIVSSMVLTVSWIYWV